MLARLPVQPRQIVRVLTLAVLIVALFGAAIALLAFLLAALNRAETPDTNHLLLACLCALIAGTFVVVFHARRETVAVPLRNRLTFLTVSQRILEELGYEVIQKTNDVLLSRPSFRAWLFGGRVQLNLGDGTAHITGPKFFVEILRARLRLNSHIANVEQSLKDNRQHANERLLKRVSVSMRLTRSQWSEIGPPVLEQLATEGAEVFCAVQLMMQSEQGMRESLIDGSLRDWLKEHGIAAEIHKDHARWEGPLTRANLNELEDTQLTSALDAVN